MNEAGYEIWAKLVGPNLNATLAADASDASLK
jgi:hypothetical protein